HDPERVNADSDRLRRFYAKNGFVDVRVISAVGSYDPAQQGIILTFTLEEGERYRLGTVEVESHIAALDAAPLRSLVQIAPGEPFNADAVERAVTAINIDVGKRGLPFATVRPHLHRNPAAKSVDLVFALDDGAHAYIE